MFFNSKIKSAVALTFAGGMFAGAAGAQAAESASFMRDGIAYRYSAAETAQGRVLTGTADGKAFRLVVKDGVVRGDFNGSLVRFAVPEKSTAVAMK